MNLVIDSGNTRFKAGLFEGPALRQKEFFAEATLLQSWLKNRVFDHALVSSVNHDSAQILSWCSALGKKIQLDTSLALPIQIKYATPTTLGVDRIAAACGAFEMFPNKNCLVIDAGTCINYEFLDQQNSYRGGAISPGIRIRFESMHTFTTLLPLLKPIPNPALIGDTTESCMQSGVINGVVAEMNGIIESYNALYPELRVILCGGDYHFFENKLKHPIFVAPDLVLSGLNRILRYHAEIG